MFVYLIMKLRTFAVNIQFLVTIYWCPGVMKLYLVYYCTFCLKIVL